MESLNRPKFRNPIWNDGAKIRENVAHLIAPTDHCMRTMVTYAPDLTEIRYVRITSPIAMQARERDIKQSYENSTEPFFPQSPAARSSYRNA